MKLDFLSACISGSGGLMLGLTWLSLSPVAPTALFRRLAPRRASPPCECSIRTLQQWHTAKHTTRYFYIRPRQAIQGVGQPALLLQGASPFSVNMIPPHSLRHIDQHCLFRRLFKASNLDKGSQRLDLTDYIEGSNDMIILPGPPRACTSSSHECV